MRFPENKRFAFSVFDDTDYSTLENVRPVYRFLAELGFRTTKSVWPLASTPEGEIGGDSLQDRAYLDFVLDLQRRGFEIGLHNVRNHDAPRETTQKGIEEFRRLVGQYPRTQCNHASNRENIYWGERRFSSRGVRFVYNLATRGARANRYEGHVESSPLFWGDICRERIQYIRNYVFNEINLDRVNPTMPYHDPDRPYVNAWFSSSQGGSVPQYCKMLCEANQDRLEAEGGVSIMYTHYGSRFFRDGRLNAEFERLMRRLAEKDGWFVPVGTILDHLAKERTLRPIPSDELASMERRFLIEKLRDRNPIRQFLSKWRSRSGS